MGGTQPSWRQTSRPHVPRPEAETDVLSWNLLLWIQFWKHPQPSGYVMSRVSPGQLPLAAQAWSWDQLMSSDSHGEKKSGWREPTRAVTTQSTV